ncbi:hypothetical protein GYH30_031328 [Glycine max]|nr:hypothetical protein GYH30_031328 [Glycine max]
MHLGNRTRHLSLPPFFFYHQTNLITLPFCLNVTKPRKLRSRQDGYAVKSSLEAEDGILYPLEKNFFFLPKPPTLILHEEVKSDLYDIYTVEILIWHAGGGSNMHYFDLLFRLKSEQEHLFRNIQRNEYHNLYEFISSKGLKITNLGDAQPTVGIKKVLENDDDDAVDPHLKHIKMKLAEMKVTRRMMKVLLLMIMGQAILMAVMMRKRQKSAKMESKKELPSKTSTSKKKSKMMKMDRRKNRRRKRTQMHPRGQCLVCSILSYWLYGFGFGCLSCGWEYLSVVTSILHSCLASEFGATITMAI